MQLVCFADPAPQAERQRCGKAVAGAGPAARFAPVTLRTTPLAATQLER